MIDTDKYEGHTEDIERWQMMARSLPDWANEKDEQLVRDAVYLLEEVKRLREVIDKEHPTFDWASRQTIAKLEAEVERLRKAIKKWEDEWCKLGDYISHYDYKMYEAIDEDIGWAE